MKNLATRLSERSLVDSCKVKYLDNQNFRVQLLALCSQDVAGNAILFILTLQFCKTYCSSCF